MFEKGHQKIGVRKKGAKNQKTLLGADELLLKLEIKKLLLSTHFSGP